MKLFELFDSDYEQSIRTKILDLLTSLFSKGVKEVHMRQVAIFLAKRKMSFTPMQISQLLEPTDFEVEGRIIKRKDPESIDPDVGGDLGGVPGMPSPEDHVGNMASNQMAKQL